MANALLMLSILKKLTKINQDCDAIDWHARAKDSIKIKYDENRKCFKRMGCSRGKLTPVNLPIKQIMPNEEYDEFLFDEIRSIPLVTKRYFNMAESVAMQELNVPSERLIYETNSSEPDIDILIEKAIPVVAQILKYQYKMDKAGFSDMINKWFCYNTINEKDVLALAKRLH